MPEMPYKPVPSVTPVERTTPGINVAFPRAEFTQSIGSALESLGQSRGVLGHATTQVGAALASLGGSFEKAGDEVWRRASAIKQMENQTAAVEADTKYMMLASKQEFDFQNKTGNAATGGLEAHMKSLDDLRKQIRGSLPNDESRHFYDHSSLQTLGRAVWRSSAYAHAQGKAASLGAEKANSDMEATNLFNHARDMTDDQFDKKLTELMDTWEKREAPIENLKGPQLEAARQQRLSKYWSHRIDGIGTTDARRALGLLDRAQDKNWVLPDAADALRTKLEKKYEGAVINNETDRLTNFLHQPKTREEREKEPTESEVVEQGRKIIDDDPMIKDKGGAKRLMELSIEGAFARVQKGRDQEDQRHRDILDKAVLGLYHRDRPPPNTMAEFFAQNEDVSGAFYGLSAKEQRIYEQNILKPKDYPETPEATAIFQQWDGLLRGEHKQETTATIAANKGLINDLPIPEHLKKELYNKWRSNQESLKKTEGELRTEHGVNVLKQNGFRTVIAKMQKPERARFDSVLSTMAEKLQGELKRPLNDKEWISLGKLVTENVKVPGTWWGERTVSRYRSFQPTTNFRDTYKEHNPNASEAEIQRAFNIDKIEQDLKAEEKRGSTVK